MNFSLSPLFRSPLLLLVGVGMVCFLSSCSGSKRLRQNGLAQLTIGKPMLSTETQRWKRHLVRDTLFNEGGYTWRASILQYKDGKVYVEEDFLGQNQINRIRVESRELRLKKGQAVGMKLADLLVTGRDWQVVYLEAYQLLDIISLYQPSVHYLVRDPQFQVRSLSQPIHIDELSATAEITAIVLM